MILFLEDYWMGRDSKYRGMWVREIQEHGADLIRRVNLLLPFMIGVEFERQPQTGSPIASGWRPSVLNDKTPGAAPFSRHITGQAIDLYDPHGEIDEWCWNHQDVLSRTEIDLYMEHPSSTKGWTHLQSVPPRSQLKFPPHDRRRWFYP